MKKTDIAMIILIASVSVIGAFFITQAFFGSATEEILKVKTIDEVSSEFVEPSPAIFNENAINPAVEVQISAEGE